MFLLTQMSDKYILEDFFILPYGILVLLFIYFETESSM